MLKMYAIACLLAIGLSAVAANVVPLSPQDCPAGTKFYSIGCGLVTREATCRESRPRPDKQQSCGYAACHCVAPTVRNEATGQCVHLDHCPGAKIIHSHGHGGVPKIERRQLPKNAHLPVPIPQRLPVAPVPVKPVAPVQIAPVPVAPRPVYNAGYTNYNAGYNNANTGYTNYNTGYANTNGNSGYSDYNNGYSNTNNGYRNYNTGYINKVVPY